MYCANCGSELSNEAKFCPYCGKNLNENLNVNNVNATATTQGKSKVVAGILNIVLPFGTGRLYAGYVTIGILQLVVSIFTIGIGSIWPFIDGILILTNNPNVDGHGQPWTD